MNRYPTSASDRGFFSTGRVITWCVLLIIAGAAFPQLKSGPASKLANRLTGAVSAARRGDSMQSVRNTGRVVTTRTRMRGIVPELTYWTSKYGVPESRQLSDVVGRSTATDAWGRPIKYQPPTKTVPGWLHSSGPDARDIRDDIYVPVTWETLTRGK